MSVEQFLEKDEKAVLHVRMSKKLHDQILKKANQMNVSITKLTEALFREFLTKKK